MESRSKSLLVFASFLKYHKLRSCSTEINSRLILRKMRYTDLRYTHIYIHFENVYYYYKPDRIFTILFWLLFFLNLCYQSTISVICPVQQSRHLFVYNWYKNSLLFIACLASLLGAASLYYYGICCKNNTGRSVHLDFILSKFMISNYAFSF